MQVTPVMDQGQTVTVDKKLLATLWILANPESYRSVADRFGMSKSTYTNILVLRLYWTFQLYDGGRP
jgi:hypothetical protein